ncbi:hypothetical protein B0H19DRAFT_1055331 [Mycena capillaripes]|nr:hypothetical protein B0H19DRAFT_1055331 [Mycena capillaripes]
MRKKVALNTNLPVETVSFAYTVYPVELPVLFFCNVHLWHPNWLSLHKLLRSRPRYHRTHISHLRRNRVAKFGLSRKVFILPCTHASFTTSFTHRAKPYADPFVDPLPDIPNPDLDAELEHDSDGIPGLLEVSDDEDDVWSTTDSIIESIPDFDYVWGSQDDYSNSSPSPSRSPPSPPGPIFAEDPLHPRPCPQNNTLRGRGSGQPRPSLAPAPVPIEISSSDEDMSDARPVSLSGWIGTGKTWSDHVPSPLKHALNSDRRVPLDARLSVIPDEKRAVSDLLFEAMPLQVTVTHPPSFSSEPENVLEDSPSHWYHHLSTAVPFLPFLRESFNNAWLAGNKSICFPHLPGKRYPLCTENFLSEIKSFIDKRNRWQTAREWLDGLRMPQDDAHADLLDRCWRVLGCLPLDGVVAGLSPAVHLTAQDLASFLGSDWLNDDMINAGVDYILRRLEPWTRVRILNCLFIQSLANAHSTYLRPRIKKSHFSVATLAINWRWVEETNPKLNIVHRVEILASLWFSGLTPCPGLDNLKQAILP